MLIHCINYYSLVCSHLLLPKHYLGPASAVGGGCCVEAVSRAFAIPLQPSSVFVDLAAQVLGQSCELLEAYLQAAAAVAARSEDDAAAASAVALTVLAIVISFPVSSFHKLMM